MGASHHRGITGDGALMELAHVAESPDTPTEELKALAGHESPLIRTLVASNPAAPDEAFETLAEDDDTVVVAVVLANLSAPQALRERIAAKHRAAYVKAGHRVPEPLAAPQPPTPRHRICGRVVRSTGRKCLLKAGHKGIRCNSVPRGRQKR